MKLSFTLEKVIDAETAQARAGVLRTSRGNVPTPVFMPVGTLGTVKTLAPWEIRQAGLGMILANAYHLYLRPGVEVVAEAGGLHRFMAWDGAILTDSGGFQVLSLAPFRKVTDEGIHFRSHIDGSPHFITPEMMVEVQSALGSDVCMQLDVCPPHGSPPEELERAADLTAEWAARSREAWDSGARSGALFSIVQGGTDVSLRSLNARRLAAIGFDGYGIGGLSVGESVGERNRVLEELHSCLPREAPRYLMGLGDPPGIIEAVKRGVDMFDSVLPTRNARHGTALTFGGPVRLISGRFERDGSPIERGCPCPACSSFSKAYLRHLLKAGETLGIRLITMHNLYFMSVFMMRVRESILSGSFESFSREFLEDFQGK